MRSFLFSCGCGGYQTSAFLGEHVTGAVLSLPCPICGGYLEQLPVVPPALPEPGAAA